MKALLVPLSVDGDAVLYSDQANARFGYSVDTAGDVNGDGYADVIVGAYPYDNGQAGSALTFTMATLPTAWRPTPGSAELTTAYRSPRAGS